MGERLAHQSAGSVGTQVEPQTIRRVVMAVVGLVGQGLAQLVVLV
jgi:hypothetical protein